ncbi:unnamed protein product [Allacma fusca]|uniref:Uncharacterized protein n=1 Tax=Allacma fusca TaxID=39272 RepID=A0A8J2PTM6_9HEXA|nr:unnamed protein product [Allacma fusca]
MDKLGHLHGVLISKLNPGFYIFPGIIQNRGIILMVTEDFTCSGLSNSLIEIWRLVPYFVGESRVGIAGAKRWVFYFIGLR